MRMSEFGTHCAAVWAATTKDKDYIQMTGMKYVVNNMEHRKEFITGDLAEFMTKGAIFPLVPHHAA